MGRLPFSKNPFSRARICKPCKEPRNRFTALRVGTTTLLAGPPSSIDPRNRFLGSLNIYKYRLSRFYLQHFEVFFQASPGYSVEYLRKISYTNLELIYSSYTTIFWEFLVRRFASQGTLFDRKNCSWEQLLIKCCFS